MVTHLSRESLQMTYEATMRPSDNRLEMAADLSKGISII